MVVLLNYSCTAEGWPFLQRLAVSPKQCLHEQTEVVRVDKHTEARTTKCSHLHPFVNH